MIFINFCCKIINKNYFMKEELQMKRKIIFIFTLIIILVFSFVSLGVNSSNNLKLSNNSNKLRIGYVESEEFSLYTSMLSNIAKNFQKIGVLDSYNIDESKITARDIWHNMCDHCISNEYEFVKDMFYNTKDMDESVYKTALNNEKVDLVIVMGTSAGKYFAENELKNKFMVFAAADPIGSGIIKSETEKINKNAFAHIDKAKYKRQIQVGHRLLNFKNVGVVYEDNEPAYPYSAISDILSQSTELNYNVVIKHVNEAKDDSDYERYYKDLEKAYKELVEEKIDVLYMTTATIQNERILSLLEKDIYKNNIPVLAQTDESQVESGATIGVTLLDTVEQAAFAVTQIKNYKEGTPFEKLEQVNESTGKIYLNYNIAKRLGINIPFSTLLIVDKIY